MARIAKALLITASICASTANAAAQEPIPKLPGDKSQSIPNGPASTEGTTDAEGEPLPTGALARLGSIRWRHGTTITGSALSSDGKRLATISPESVAVWDLATGKTLFRFPVLSAKKRADGYGYTQGPGAIAFSPDGRWLGIAFLDFGVWDLENGGAFRRFGDKDDFFTSGVSRFTADSKKFLLQHHGGDVVSCDVSNGKIESKLSLGEKWAQIVDISEDAKLYAWREISPGNAISVRSSSTNSDIMKLSASHPQSTPAFSPNGKMVALVDNASKLVQIWDIGATRPRMTFRLPKSAIDRTVDSSRTEFVTYCVQFSADSKQLLMGTGKGKVHRWDLMTKKQLPVLGQDLSEICSVHALPDGKTLIITESNLVHLWDTAKNIGIAEPKGFRGPTHAVLSPDKSIAAISDFRGQVELWDVQAAKYLRTVREGKELVTAHTFAPNGKTLAVGLEDGTVAFHDVASGREIMANRFAKKNKLGIFYSAIVDLQYSPDGNSLGVQSMSRDFCFRELATGKSHWTAKGEPGFPPGRSYCISRDGKTCALIVDGQKLSILDAATGKERKIIPVKIDEHWQKPGSINSIAMSSDGKRLAAALSEKTIVILDVHSGTEIMRMPDEGWSGRTLDYSPDGQLLAVGGVDEVSLRDALTGQDVLRLSGHRGSVSDIAFLGGQRLLSCGEDSQVYLWTLRPKSPTGKQPLESAWLGLASADAAVAYRAVWDLADDQSAADFLRKRIAPEPPIEQVDSLVADLGSTDFKKREAATRALGRMGERAGPALNAALKKSPSLEASRRINELLHTLSKLSPDRLRPIRAVQAMELAATPESRRLIEYWSKGAAGCSLTEAALAALRRLESRY